jgi:hypothetical protein
MNLYLLITALAIFGGFLKVAQIVLSGKPEHSEADSANSPDVKNPWGAIQLGVPEGHVGIPYSFEDPTYIGMTLDSHE